MFALYLCIFTSAPQHCCNICNCILNAFRRLSTQTHLYQNTAAIFLNIIIETVKKTCACIMISIIKFASIWDETWDKLDQNVLLGILVNNFIYRVEMCVNIHRITMNDNIKQMNRQKNRKSYLLVTISH